MKKLNLALTILTIIIATFLRIYKLGYSDFQGDEVSAQNFLFDHQTFSQFLLSRTIGPGQYIIAYMANSLANQLAPVSTLAQNNLEFFVRLPFALASVATLTAIYYTVAKLLHKNGAPSSSTTFSNNQNVALLATAFIGFSGLMVAFARIVQYQSFVMLFSILTIFFVIKFFNQKHHTQPKDQTNKQPYKQIQLKQIPIIYAGIFSGIALLFHYDALSFIIPVALLLLLKKCIKSLIIYSFTISAIATLFYLPFMLNPLFKSTFSYLLSSRISSAFTYDSVYYSYQLFTLYHSKEFLIFIIILTAFALVSALTYNFKEYPQLNLTQLLLITGTTLIIARILTQTKNDLLLYSSVIVFTILFAQLIKQLLQKSLTAHDIFKVWFLFSFIVYGLFISKPLTHIYTFFIPASVMLAITVAGLLELPKGTPSTATFCFAKGATKHLTTALLIIVLIATLSFNYSAFLNNSPEYPWNHKNYIFGQMPSQIANGQVIHGVFGFPYNRNWKEISQNAGQLKIKSYSSNEKYRLTKYYMQGYSWKNDGEIYIYVKKPQSLEKMQAPAEMPIYESETYAIYAR